VPQPLNFRDVPAQVALSKAEDAFGVAVQEQVVGFVVETEAGEVLEAVLGRPGRVVGAEQDPVVTATARATGPRP